MAAGASPSWSAVLQNIVSNVQDIVRSEVRLAKTEIKEGAQAAAKPSATLGAGLVFGFYAFGFLCLCVVYALALVVATWISALIVAVVLGLAAFIMVKGGLKGLKAVQAKPERTLESVKETVQWAKDQSK